MRFLNILAVILWAATLLTAALPNMGGVWFPCGIGAAFISGLCVNAGRTKGTT